MKVLQFPTPNFRNLKGEIWMECAECHICLDPNTPVICVDSSEGEYGPGRVCFNCARNMFKNFNRKEFRNW